MNVRIKRALARLMAVGLLTVCFLQAFSLQARAAGPIDMEQDVSLVISFLDEQKAISDAHFSIYKVAEIDKYAKTTLTSEFDQYLDSIAFLSDLDQLAEDQFNSLAVTLKGYVLNDGLKPMYEGKTDNDGNLRIDNMEMGLYLVIGERTSTDDEYIYTPVPFMVFLPSYNAMEDGWIYHLNVIPKYSKEHQHTDDEPISRKVLKKWDDEGYESIRPSEVTVQLLRDGNVFDTQTLNQENQWCYEWNELSADHDWTVIEKAMKGYVITIEQSGITFTITNRFAAIAAGTDIPVQKRITGDQPSEKTTFRFVLKAKDAAYPMPEGSINGEKEVSIVGAGSQKFGEITFEKPGTYVYTVNEINDGVDGYTYDTAMYTVTFQVVSKSNKFSIEKEIINDKGELVSVIEFTNPYKQPDNPLPYTGMLWWPVPVLLAAGIFFLMMGMIRRRRSN